MNVDANNVNSTTNIFREVFTIDAFSINILLRFKATPPPFSRALFSFSTTFVSLSSLSSNKRLPIDAVEFVIEVSAAYYTV